MQEAPPKCRYRDIEPSQASVAVSTTSVLSDRTEQCSGTVRTVRAGAGWLLDGISINCTP